MRKQGAIGAERLQRDVSGDSAVSRKENAACSFPSGIVSAKGRRRSGNKLLKLCRAYGKAVRDPAEAIKGSVVWL